MNNNYKYSGQPLSRVIAEEIIRDRAKWKKRFKAKFLSIVDYVNKEHIKLGGLPAEEDSESVIRSALYMLHGKGFARIIPKDLWEFPKYGQRIFGVGDEWVYLYYFETDKKEAESKGESSWRCKIGKAEKDPENRVKNQTSGCPVPPIIALLFRTNDCDALEKVMHACLKLHGKHMSNTQGKEWFNVNPDDIVSIFKIIVNDIERSFRRRSIGTRISQ